MNVFFKNPAVFVWLTLTASLSLFFFYFSSMPYDMSYCPRGYISLDRYIDLKNELFITGIEWSVGSGGVCKILEILLRSRKRNLAIKLFVMSFLMTFVAIYIGNIQSFPVDISSIEYCEREWGSH
jgi:hypothetical protein